MTADDIIARRLINQRIAESEFKEPARLVSWMVAMQAQVWDMAKWAIGLRVSGSSNASVEMAFDEGTILRTHVMRPTWHFVSPADIRWLLKLTAPRVHAINAYQYRQTGLDAKKLNRGANLLAKALVDGKYLTRDELKNSLNPIKLSGDGVQLACAMMYAELEGLICSGPRIGKQFSYALMDERVPNNKNFTREDALAEVAKRYFQSRGPATLQDFSTWSGLSMKDIREAVEMIGSSLLKDTCDDKEYYFFDTELKDVKKLQSTFLMPDYDEYGMAYKNREAMIDPEVISMQKLTKDMAYTHFIIVDGKVAGTWRRSQSGKQLELETNYFAPIAKTKEQTVDKAMKKYLKFFS